MTRLLPDQSYAVGRTCTRCEGEGWDPDADRFEGLRCRECRGSGWELSASDVAALVDKALDLMWDNYRPDEFNPLHVRNVVMNHALGPEMGYLRARHALSRNPRVKHLRTSRDILGSLAVYGWADSAAPQDQQTPQEGS